MVKADDTIGSYRILSRIGVGGMGQVWLAEHTLIGRRVAIKLIKPELSDHADLIERFFDEARAAARIEDAGLVQVHDFGRHEGSAYMVMELLIGEALAARLARERRTSVALAARLGTQAAMTMEVAHARGIIHRDLKPDNLFLVTDTAVVGGVRVKILDFGIAKLLCDRDIGTRTETGVLLGTPTYMSPEQARNAAAVDHRSDVYSLGCVLFHMVCGRPPFTGTSSGDLIASHLIDTPPVASALSPDVPPELDTVIARCLAKSPDDRYASMTDLARALAAFGDVTPPVEPRGGRAISQANIGLLPTLATGDAEAAPRSRRRTLIAFAILSAAIAVTGAVWFASSRAPRAAATTSAPKPPPDASLVKPLPPVDAAIDATLQDAAADARSKPRAISGSAAKRDENAYEY